MHNRGTRRHWHGVSEKYTGGDSLVAALQDGWEISKVAIQEKPLHGSRTVIIYHFDLSRDEETLVMSVIATPFITRLVAYSAFPVLSPNEP